MDLTEKISTSTLYLYDKRNHSYLQQNFEYKAELRVDPCKADRHLFILKQLITSQFFINS
jgi:hypothetical protein